MDEKEGRRVWRDGKKGNNGWWAGWKAGKMELDGPKRKSYGGILKRNPVYNGAQQGTERGTANMGEREEGVME